MRNERVADAEHEGELRQLVGQGGGDRTDEGEHRAGRLSSYLAKREQQLRRLLQGVDDAEVRDERAMPLLGRALPPAGCHGAKAARGRLPLLGEEPRSQVVLTEQKGSRLILSCASAPASTRASSRRPPSSRESRWRVRSPPDT